MMYQRMGRGALDYDVRSFGASRLQFRGPSVDFEHPYLTFLGSTETYGKYAPYPFPALVAERLETQSLNLGVTNGGPDVFWANPDLLDMAKNADLTVVQIMGAANLSNRFYSVHPRRNDRFIKTNAALDALYPGIDVTEVHFTRHLLRRLQEIGPGRYVDVVSELQAAWQARMTLMLRLCQSRVVLLWIKNPEDPAMQEDLTRTSGAIYVSAQMVDALRPLVQEVIEVTPSQAAMSEGARELIFDPLEVDVAHKMMSAAAHREVAQQLAPVLKRLL